MADFEDIARTSDAFDPAEFGNVDETLDTFFDFDKSTVGEEFGDASLDVVTDRVFPLDVFPRVLRHLLETERDAFFLAVDVEDDDIHELSDMEDFRRVVDATPRHVGDVE